MDRFDRREALAALTLALGGKGVTPAREALQRSDRLSSENKKEGTTDWQLTNVRMDPKAKFRQSLLEGYANRMSVFAGEKISFHVSSKPEAPFHIDIYRLGYYQGTGGRHLGRFGPFPGKAQTVPEFGAKRLRECDWAPCTTLEIPLHWPSGVYLGKLTSPKHRYQSYVIFIVKDNRPADFLFQCSTNTWQAYNKWPDASSLYDNDRKDQKPLVPNVQASFDRPFAKYPQVTDNPLSLGTGEFLLFEFPFSYWLEQQGYDVTYCSNEDIHKHGLPFVTRTKGFLSIGHDEYWSRAQFDTCLEAVKAGVNFGFFSGNAVCFVTPFSPSTRGAENRIIERKGRYGGMRPEEEKWMAELETAPNENTLIGARTVIPFNGSGDWICTNPEHWIFAHTRMKKGDRIPGLVGWEHHGNPAEIAGIEVVAAGKTWNSGEEESHYEATIYPGPKGNTVFNAATIFWAQGLGSPPGHWLPFVHNGRPHGPDKRVQQITKNLLEKWRS